MYWKLSDFVGGRVVLTLEGGGCRDPSPSIGKDFQASRRSTGKSQQHSVDTREVVDRIENRKQGEA